ncbi:MAG: alpha-L-fucosidase [Candidatus Hydrogenedentes bacterium]|nr:alpha-L-fucosidase [Candidatus Hydrogenedentota bacterium]
MLRTAIVAVIAFGGFAAIAQQPAKPLALPTKEQAAWQDYELGMFIHFAPNTWQDEEYDKRTTPLSEINPAQLNTDEWVAAAESFGAKYIVFVAKHVGGFCMWQTDTTSYGIKNTPWRDGKGDVLKDLSESCAKRGMKLGVYLSPRDDTLGADTGGVCKTPEEQKKYDAIYRQQLTEIMTKYGELAEIWFDGSTGIEVGDLLKQYAPKAMYFQSKYATIRWVGNEDGFAPYPAWNAVSEAARARGATAKDGDPNGNAWLPNECDARIRRDWFYSSKNGDTLKSVDDLLEMYYLSVGHGAVLLLNMTPDTTGRFPEADVKRLAEFGAEINRRFGKSLAETGGQGSVVELALDKPTKIDHIITMEDITQGERVREYVIEGFIDGAWKELCNGTAIGHKKIDRIESSTVTKVRLRVTNAAAEPQIRKLAVYKTEQ